MPPNPRIKKGIDAKNNPKTNAPPPSLRQRQSRQRRGEMGSILSSFIGGGTCAGEYSSSEDHSGITAFNSSARWQLHFNSAKQSPQLMVIDFTAAWCGPCRFMEPALHAMAARFTDVQFVQIDVDQLPDVARDFGVQAMPTFVLVKSGKEVGRVIGARKDELERRIQQNKAVAVAAAT